MQLVNVQKYVTVRKGFREYVFELPNFTSIYVPSSFLEDKGPIQNYFTVTDKIKSQEGINIKLRQSP